MLSTRMSMEVSNQLASWLLTYLGDLQPTYTRVIIHLLSTMNIPVYIQGTIFLKWRCILDEGVSTSQEMFFNKPGTQLNPGVMILPTKLCIVIRDIPQNCHRFVLFWFPNGYFNDPNQPTGKEHQPKTWCPTRWPNGDSCNVHLCKSWVITMYK